MKLFYLVFTVRVVYKSGYTHDFECTKFKITGKSTYEWQSVNQRNQPVLLGADEVAAVWQIGVRRCLNLFGRRTA